MDGAQAIEHTAVDDPVLLAIIQKQLDHVTHQMGWVTQRTARSPIFNVSHDFSCFLGTANGVVVAQADGLPIHSAAGGFALRALLDQRGDEIEEGDVFISGDPYAAGGNHLPDWTVMRPVFVEGRLCAFACNRAHQSDIGGGAAGTYNPEATEIFHEGLRLPILKLVERGRLRRDLMELLLLNSRCPDLMEGDLGAMLGSCAIGAERVLKLIQEIGADRIGLYLEAVLDHAERRLRQEIAALPDGEWYGEDGSDTDCFRTVEVPVKVKLTIDGDRLTFDFTGSSPQVKGFKNSSLANTHSSVFVAIASFFDVSLPRNGGTFRPVTIIAPAGSVVNALPPAPMTMNTVFPAIDIIHACWKALGQVAPERACAGWGKSAYGVSSGRVPGTGRNFVMYHWHGASGGGAVQGRDGFPQSGPMSTLGGLTIPNVEHYERVYPCRIERQELRLDSAGAGEFRGGASVNYAAEIFVDSEHAIRGEGARRPTSFGVNGGTAGAKGSMMVAERGEDLTVAPQYAVQRVGPMRVVLEGTAGGGWGPPYRRDAALVLRDVLDEIVSRQAAQDIYGVVLTADGTDVDGDQTAMLRRGRQ